MYLENEQLRLYNAARKTADTAKFCHAPFNNLFFGNRGYVMGCCFNKVHVLGRYPESTISQIWKGDKAEQLRAAMNQFDLSKGCHGCQSIFGNGNFGGVPAKVYDNHGQPDNGYPKRMEFELDNTCNLECVMCSGEFSSSIRERRERKPAIQSPYDREFLNQLEEFLPHLETAQFLGGEPFLIPVYYEIWERMIEVNPNIKISIQTNGTILNSRVKRVLEKLKVSISVSIDSLDKDVYPTIRVNGELPRVLENIDYFSNYVKQSGTAISFSFCPMVQNWKEIPAMVEFSNRHSAHVFFNSVFSPAECSLMGLSAEELNEITAYLASFSFAAGNALQAINKQRFNDLRSEISSFSKKAEGADNSNTASDLSFAGYLGKMEEFINSRNELNTAEKISANNTLSTRLKFLIEEAGKEGIREQAETELVKLSPLVLYEALREMEDMDRAYLLFKERLLKLI